MTKLANLSTAKHLKYSMKYTDSGMEFKRHTESITNVQFPSNFLRMPPTMYFDDSVNFCKLLDRKCYFLGFLKSITVNWNILRLIFVRGQNGSGGVVDYIDATLV